MKLILFLCLLFSVNANAMSDEDKQYIKDFLGIDIQEENLGDPLTQREIEQITERSGQDANDQYTLSIRGDAAIKNWVRLVSFMLKRRGYDEEAEKLSSEYRMLYSTSIVNFYFGVSDKLGDHPPLSKWLALWYVIIEAKLGTRVCELLHLDDINILNYSVPVVFQPKGDERFPPIIAWGKEEYSLHFVPFSGVVAYWTTYAVCVGATWGAGAIAFICTPIGDVAEKIMVKSIAPPLSDRVYDRFNP